MNEQNETSDISLDLIRRERLQFEDEHVTMPHTPPLPRLPIKGVVYGIDLLELQCESLAYNVHAVHGLDKQLRIMIKNIAINELKHYKSS